MPIYEFKCPDCDHVFDEIVRCGTQLAMCPLCSGVATKSMGSYLTVATNLPNGFARGGGK